MQSSVGECMSNRARAEGVRSMVGLYVCNVSHSRESEICTLVFFYFSQDFVWSLLWDHTPKTILHCWMDDIVFFWIRTSETAYIHNANLVSYNINNSLFIYWAVHKASWYINIWLIISSYITYWNLQNPFTGFTFLADEANFRKMTDNHKTMTMPIQSGADHRSPCPVQIVLSTQLNMAPSWYIRSYYNLAQHRVSWPLKTTTPLSPNRSHVTQSAELLLGTRCYGVPPSL